MGLEFYALHTDKLIFFLVAEIEYFEKEIYLLYNTMSYSIFRNGIYSFILSKHGFVLTLSRLFGYKSKGGSFMSNTGDIHSKWLRLKISKIQII